MDNMEAAARNAKILSAHLQNCEVDTKEARLGYEAILELIDQPWEDLAPEMALWREGYAACMRDITDAIGQEWKVPLGE